MRVKSLGHAAFALTMIVIGVSGLITGSFATIWQAVPQGMPARGALAYLVAIICLLGGAGLLWQRWTTQASRLLLGFLLAWLLLLRLPQLFGGLTVDVWWAACKSAEMAAAAWVPYVWFAADWDRQRLGLATGETGLRIARMLSGLALIPFGLAHFLYIDNTAPLVPGWLPWHVAWAYFTGAAFIAAGIAMLAGRWARLAAALAALQIGLFTLLVWVPRVLAGKVTPFQWGEFTVSATLTAAAWLVADSYRGVPWRAVGRR